MRTLSYAAAALVVAASLPSVLSAQDVRMLTTERGNRAVLGVSTASGGPRDTIGVLVADVTVDGPADKAGIQEGDRIVSIGDVDLRLAPADAGSNEMRGVMGRRLAHALAKHAPGDVVEMRVFHDGQFVARKVTTGKASEVFVMPAVSFGNLDDPGPIFLERSQEQMRHLRLAPLAPFSPDSNHVEFQIYNNGTHRI